MAAVATDCASWELSDKEAAALAAPGSAALNEFVTVQPKWVALALFGLSAAGIVAEKWARYAVFQRAVEQERADADARARAGAPSVQPPSGPGPVELPSGAAALIAKAVDPGAAR
jgi:hypothetical protein